jgi:hypothetical protein
MLLRVLALIRLKTIVLMAIDDSFCFGFLFQSTPGFQRRGFTPFAKILAL